MATRPWLAPSLLTAAMLVNGLAVSFLPTSAQHRGVMLTVSVLATACVASVSFLYALVLRPRIGAVLGYVSVSLVVFVAATLLSITPGRCVYVDIPRRCTLTESVASGFALMLVPLAFGLVSLLFSTIRASLRVFRGLFSTLARPPVGKVPSSRRRPVSKERSPSSSSKKSARSRTAPSGRSTAPADPGKSRDRGPKGNGSKG